MFPHLFLRLVSSFVCLLFSHHMLDTAFLSFKTFLKLTHFIKTSFRFIIIIIMVGASDIFIRSCLSGTSSETIQNSWLSSSVLGVAEVGSVNIHYIIFISCKSTLNIYCFSFLHLLWCSNEEVFTLHSRQTLHHSCVK